MNALWVIGRRLIQLVVVVLVVTFVVFMLAQWNASNNRDPVDLLKPFATEEQKAEIRADLGLDESLVAQYWDWLSGFVRGDLGQDYNNNQEVSEQVSKGLPATLTLILYAQVIALFFALPFGVLTAYKNGSVFDRITNATAFGLLAIPVFVAYLVLSYFVGAQWQLFPEATGAAGQYVELWEDPVQNLKILIIPAVALALPQIAIYMRLLRSDMIATLQDNFVLVARSKGLTDSRILVRHALRPSSLTLLTVAGLNIGTLIGGAVVVEVLASIPGLGTQLYESVITNQYRRLLSLTAVIAIIYVSINFIVDFFYTVLDPRIRHARATA